MHELPQELLDIIKNHIKKRSRRGEKGWDYSNAEEDSVVGDYLGNLRSEKKTMKIDSKTYYWIIYYKKFQGRGPGAEEKRIGADSIISLDIEDKDTNIKTTKSIIFQAKKVGNNSGLIVQKKKMDKYAKNGNFILTCGPNGYFASEDINGGNTKVGDFLADQFLACKVGIKGMYYDPIRKELTVDKIKLTQFEFESRVLIDIGFWDDSNR